MNFEQNDSCDQKILLLTQILQSLYNFISTLVSSNEKVLESNECKLGSIILFKNFDEPRVEYTGEIKKTVIIIL